MSARELTTEQRAAATALDREVLLAAGAGTGKTTVLVERYSEALAQDPESGVDGIVAFTFTERAAAQLRERIRAELRRRGLAGLARDTDRARISTIHGFCMRLISAHTGLLGLDPRFRVLDAAGADRVAAVAFGDALDEFVASEGEIDRTRIVAAFRPGPLRSLIHSVYDELRSRGEREPALPEISPPDPVAVLAELRAACDAALLEDAEATGVHAERRRAKIERVRELCDAEQVPRGDAVAAAGKFSFSKAGEAMCAFMELLPIAEGTLNAVHDAPVYNELRELLALFGARYAELKAERSGLDFEDLQLEAVRLLGDNAPVRDALHEHLRHLMVDELQDTNRLQLRLIELLCGPATERFAVGDELQSIYAFRHADLDVFRAARARVEAMPDEQGEALELTESFRSLPAVIDSVNEVGGHLIGGFKPLRTGRGADGAGEKTELLLTPTEGWKPEHPDDEDLFKISGPDFPSGANRMAEARFLAHRLREVVDAGEAERGEIVVLVRARTHVAAIEEELDRAGLRPYVVAGRGYWSEQQVDDVRCLLGVIANPLDDPSLLGVLASPACSVSPDTLWMLRQAAGPKRHLWPPIADHFGNGGASEEGDEQDEETAERAAWIERIAPEDGERLRLLCERLEALRSRAGLLRLDELIERAVRETEYDLAVVSMKRSRRRFANVRKLMRMARAFEAAEGRDLRGFLEYLGEQAASDADAEAATEAEDHDGVRIMTVHAAKGLEFPVVAVADLGRELTLGGRAPGVIVGRESEPADPAERPVRVGIHVAQLGRVATRIFDYDELTKEAAEAEAEEACRLTHVAGTRARDRLILSGVYRPSAVEKLLEGGELKPSTAITERLMFALGIGKPSNGPLGESLLCRYNEPDPEAFAALRPMSAGPAAAAAMPDPSEAPEPLPAADATTAVSRLSYSSISTFESCGYRYYAQRVLGLPPERPFSREPAGISRGAGFGNAIHSILEWCARNGWRDPGSDQLAAALVSHGLDPGAALERAEGMVGGFLESDLCEQVRGANTARAELAFALPLAGSLIRGKIDLLADLADGTRLVIDYKTDSLGDSTPAELLADRYESQRRIYALAARPGNSATLRTAYVFLEQFAEPQLLDFGELELDAVREQIAATVGRISDREFEVSDDPNPDRCRGCPARANLCIHGPELTKPKPVAA